MKPRYLILVLALSFAVNNLFGQTNHPTREYLPWFDAASQSNIEIIASDSIRNSVPCPPEFTNVISNTNLFTLDEQKLLKEIPLIFANVTTNSGPVGSVLVDYKAKPIESSYGTFWYWTARFQFTNSDTWDEVTPGGDMKKHKIRNKNGDGYDLEYAGESFVSTYGSGANFGFHQVRHNVYDGLSVNIEHGEHCSSWMQYSNGLAVDKWLYWTPDGSKLGIWLKFKKPVRRTI